jgi:murein L,D-transpeptidase YcbB/YkuD
LCLFAPILLFAASCRSEPEPTAREAEALEAVVKSGAAPPFVPDGELSSRRWEYVVSFYRARDFRPAWTARGTRQKAAADLAAALEQAPNHGLHPVDYNIEPSGNPIEDDVRLTWVLLRFAHDLAGPRKREPSVENVVAKAIESRNPLTIVDELAPKHAEYRGLQHTLTRLRQTTDELTIRQLENNMARLRQLPADLGNRYIRVNIPEYRLDVVENGAAALTMRIVVGKEETPTPVFSSKMTHLVFSPYWNVPDSILTNEMLPQLLQNRNFFAQQRIEVVRVSGGRAVVVDPSSIDWSTVSANSGYQLRQLPGAHNSLGLVKFMLPNKHNVYLHDTPADSLFLRSERDFSHGCVRLERPLELALYLLRDRPEWTKEKIEAAMHSGSEKTVNLNEPLPVHIMYLTASVAADGTLTFLKDIYRLDAPAGSPATE